MKPATRNSSAGRKRCAQAANLMCLLCLLNIGPVLLVTAMGMAGAAITHPERNFPTARAMLIGLAVFAFPFLITQAFVRRGHRAAIFAGIVVELLFLAGAVFLMVNVAAGPFPVQFKLMAGMLSLVGVVAYGVGVVRLFQAVREVLSERTPGGERKL